MNMIRAATHELRAPVMVGILILTIILFGGLGTVYAQSGSVTVTLQPGPGNNDGTNDGSIAAGKDTWINNGYNPDWPPSGTEPWFFLWNISCNQYRGRGLLRFSLDGMPTQNIVSAKVHVFTTVFFNGSGSPWLPGDQQISVRKLTSDWNEVGLTWDSQPSFDATGIDPKIVHTSGCVTGGCVEFQGWLVFDITALYQEWANGTAPNYGMMFHLDTSVCQNGDEVMILTSDWAGGYSDWPGTEGRPKLVVVYDEQPQTYNIVASAGLSGSIDPSGPVSVISGESQAFNISPNPGYRVEDVWVDGASVGALTSFTFTNVAGSHTIQAFFAIDGDIRYDLIRARVNGCVTKQGVINSLLAKLDNAEAAERRGNMNAKAGMIGAFINEVGAQAGKAIPKACAADLITLARLL